MSSQGNPGPVPPRWLKCPRKSNRLIIDKFVALKTPLSSRFDSQVPPADRFPPKMLFDFYRSKKIKFGLWIDLTNTSRFYDKADIEKEDCKYIKLACKGHSETPSREQTDGFIKLVDLFFSKNPLEKVAVHCTHGFNRTGFLIVSYIVERMDTSLNVALDIFAQARPNGIYKGDYIRELYRRFDDIADAPPSPVKPDWCYEDESNNFDDYDDSSEISASSSSEPKPKRKRMSTARFMDGVPGVVEINDSPKANHLRQKIKQMCGWKGNDFPGCQPISMDLNNINDLHIKPYRVSWKADGTRYMMLIDGEDEVYFFDRDNNVYKVSKLRFLHRKDLSKHLKNTLIDGEMVIDKVNGVNIPRYLVYDIVTFENDKVGKLPFYPNRLKYIENDIIYPRHAAMERGIINKQDEPFSVRKKDFWHITQAANLLGEKFAKTLSHEPDGLIFQPSQEEYIAGRCDYVLKWKPSSMNSVDFRLKIGKEGGMGIVPKKIGYLYVGQAKQPFGRIKYTKALADLDNKIIECKMENGEWKFMRERTDKSFPNSLTTAQAVFESIKHPVTEEILLDFIAKHRFCDDSELMRPPSRARR